jgi:hypothetical protein
MQSSEDDLDTPIWGAAAIARVINRPLRAAYHLFRNQATAGAQGRSALGEQPPPATRMRPWR